jgi:hypothetical protein
MMRRIVMRYEDCSKRKSTKKMKGELLRPGVMCEKSFKTDFFF